MANSKPNNLVKIITYTILILALMILLTPNLFAVTDADFKDELAKGEKVIGNLMRIAMLVLVGVAVGISMLKQNWLLLGLSAIALLFLSLMRNWITSNFAAII